MISDKTIEAVRNLDIEDVLKSWGLEFRRRGSTMFASCPFHSEKTPSFSITPGRNLWYCHSCHRGGDGIRFYMEREGMDFIQAVEAIAKANNLHIEYTKEEQTDEQREAARLKESVLAVVATVHKFFFDQLRVELSDEARAAREYAYSRWPEDFCSTCGIGLAPKDSKLLMEYCKSKAITEDLLVQSGIYKQDEKSGRIYTLFRNRLVIPIRDRFGRVIAFTARYLGDDKADNVGKYVNSSNSSVFTKGESVFGIDRASRCRDALYYNIVEGAPDVLRLQSIGLDNTVATLGTAWSGAQFDILKKHIQSLCFIPDSDPPKDEPFGPGFKAVMTNGAEAVRRGFDVTVRELPFQEEKTEDDAVILHKNDADEYILTPEIYAAIPEKPFILWLAEKKFSVASSLAEQRVIVAEVADLLRHISEDAIADECIASLAKINGTVKSWKAAVSRAKGEARQRAAKSNPKNDAERRKELLRVCNLNIIDNCFYTYDEGEAVRLSNFYLESLYHIKDETNGTRLFRMVNKFNEAVEIEFRESELCSLTTFQQRVGSVGNYIWRAKIDKLNNVKEYLYRGTRSAERVRKMGWDAVNGFFAFGNGVFNGDRFLAVDDLGIVETAPNRSFYIPATSKMYENNPEIYQFERLFIHENRSGIKLYDFAMQLVKVFGDNAKIAFCYLLATLYRDVIFNRTRHFPILNLFGEKGTGKTTLATSLQSFFIHSVDPPNLGVTSVPAMNDRVSQAVNSLVVFDEYKNDLDVRKIAYLKGLWGGGGQTKKNQNTDGMAAQTIISTGIALCGQDKPTQDMALFTRVLFLAFSKTSFSKLERDAYEDLVAMCSLGNTHLTLEVLSHRALFEKNFSNAYSLTKSELSKIVEGEKIHDRIFGNWIIPLAAFRTLESVLSLPFGYNDLLTVAVAGMRLQNETAQESSEMGDFWEALQGFHTQGRAIDKAHFRIKWHRTFRSTTMKEDMIFAEPTPVLYLNSAAVAGLFNGRGASNATANRSNWSTMLSYLRSHPSFLGLKQDRFTILLANGTPDYTFETVNGTQTKKMKVNRPKAMCFNYAMLKAEFGLNLETEVISETEELAEDAEPTDSAPVSPALPTKPTSLFDTPDKEEDMPF
ncbi:MAG TPA: DNA primase [Porphyromonadaceae bacterium]|nr:DNA primase [Porphyromonadaceae bacterium]